MLAAVRVVEFGTRVIPMSDSPSKHIISRDAPTLLVAPSKTFTITMSIISQRVDTVSIPHVILLIVLLDHSQPGQGFPNCKPGNQLFRPTLAIGYFLQVIRN